MVDEVKRTGCSSVFVVSALSHSALRLYAAIVFVFAALIAHQYWDPSASISDELRSGNQTNSTENSTVTVGELTPKMAAPAQMTRDEFLGKVQTNLGWYGADRGVFCGDEACFYVKDTFGGVTVGDRPVRGIYIFGFGTVAVSQAILNIPDEFTETNLDTVSWSINKTFVQPIGYMFPVVAGIFASQALPNDENTDGNVLFLGLGGGTLNNLLTAGYPNINVTSVDINPVMKEMAVQLFDNVETEKNHIVIVDGVEFMRAEIAREAHYDAIIGDVCYNNGDKPNICPIDLFLDDNVAALYKQLLKPTGFLAHNVVARGELTFQDEIITNILALHKRHFGDDNCVMYKCHSIRNFVLMCRPSGMPSSEDFQRVEREFAARFGYQIVEDPL